MAKTDVATLNNLRKNEHDIDNIQLLPIVIFVSLLALYISFDYSLLMKQTKTLHD